MKRKRASNKLTPRGRLDFYARQEQAAFERWRKLFMRCRIAFEQYEKARASTERASKALLKAEVFEVEP